MLKKMVFFIAPLSVLMGMPFPLGLRLARQTNPLNISWAWSVNGCSSVISVVAASIIAIEWGFGGVMAVAACMYITAWAATFSKPFQQHAYREDAEHQAACWP